jgi:hypothetical protein
MRGKIIFVLGAAAGYVIGTKRGRKGYEQLKGQASDVWQNPRVQKTVADVENYAREQLPVVKDQLSDAAKKVADTVAGAVKKTQDVPESTATTASGPTTSPTPRDTTDE